jgi:multidrug resistance efflux pump
MKTDRTLLEAALLGYQARIAAIEAAMAALRSQLGQSSGAGPAPVKQARRKMSAAGRRRIAAAQKKRWAEHSSLFYPGELAQLAAEFDIRPIGLPA